MWIWTSYYCCNYVEKDRKLMPTAFKLSIELVETASQIEELILKSLFPDLNIKVGPLEISIENQIKFLLTNALYSQPECQSLASQGKLAKDLGLEDGYGSISTVIEQVVSKVKVNIKGFGLSKSKAFTTFDVRLEVDLEELINDSDAKVETKKGQILPWLEWLLMEGPKRFVEGYKVYYASIPKPRSRSGGAIMVKDESSSWGVPPEFAGTENDNFITRAIASVQKQLKYVIEAETKKAFK